MEIFDKNRKIDLLIIAHFSDDFDSNGNNRFNYLATLFSDSGYSVELITSGFSHTKKRKRKKEFLKDTKYIVTYINEPPYKKNISVMRFISHHIMSRNLKSYLKRRKKPDIIYCAIPSLDVGNVVAKYSRENNIRFIIDIQDLWPEAFEMVFRLPLISHVLYLLLKMKANYIYKNADDIVVVSNTYGKVASKVNKSYHVVYLGTDLKYFDKCDDLSNPLLKEETDIWIVYIGTLGASYDLIMVLEALEMLKNRGLKNIKFIVMGDGPTLTDLRNEAKKRNLDVKFMGRLEYKKMVGVLKRCDIAVNPIRVKSAGSIINKVADYAAAGLPVVNTQQNSEYRDLLAGFEAGINCETGSSANVAHAIEKLIMNEELRKKMSINSRRLAEEKFDRATTYNTIQNVISNYIKNL